MNILDRIIDSFQDDKSESSESQPLDVEIDQEIRDLIDEILNPKDE